MAKILLTTIGTTGDVLPFVRIGAELKNRGHAITLISNCSYHEMVRAAGLGFAAIDDMDGSRQFIADGVLSNSPQGFLAMYRQYFLPRVRPEYELIKQLAGTDETVVVARSTPSIAALFAAEALRLPLVSVFLAPSFISSMPLVETLLGAVLGREINEIRKSIGLQTVEDWKNWFRFPRKYIGLWPEWFAPVDSHFAFPVPLSGFVLPGPPANTSLPSGVEEILNSSESTVLLTGGTGNFASLAACMDACGQLGLRGIFVSAHQEFIKDSPMKHFIWCQQLPFEKVMPRVRLVIHHGGIGTLAQALAAGVPQLIIGSGADRPDNAAHLKRLNVGQHLPRTQQHPEEIIRSLHDLMTDHVREKCEEIARRLAVENGTAAACDAIEALLPQMRSSVPRDEPTPPTGLSSGASGKYRERSEIEAGLNQLSPAKRALLERRLARESKDKTRSFPP